MQKNSGWLSVFKGSKFWLLRILTYLTSLNLFKNQAMEREGSVGKIIH
jgi:hypothetical protein